MYKNRYKKPENFLIVNMTNVFITYNMDTLTNYIKSVRSDKF